MSFPASPSDRLFLGTFIHSHGSLAPWSLYTEPSGPDLSTGLDRSSVCFPDVGPQMPSDTQIPSSSDPMPTPTCCPSSSTLLPESDNRATPLPSPDNRVVTRRWEVYTSNRARRRALPPPLPRPSSARLPRQLSQVPPQASRAPGFRGHTDSLTHT